MSLIVDRSTVAEVSLDYFRPWRVLCPVIGNLGQADCIWTLAYGRNTYNDKDLGQIIQTYRLKSANNNVATYALFQDDGFDPGEPNFDLAKRTMEFAGLMTRDSRIPHLMLQWEIAYAIWHLNQQWYEANLARIFPLWPDPSKPYYPSIEVIADAAAVTASANLRTPALVAHDAQRVRVVGICWKRGWSPVVPDCHVNSYDPNSVQPKTRSAQAWRNTEILARIHHLVLRHVILTPPRLR